MSGRARVLLAATLAVLAFAGHETSLRDTYYRVLTDLQGGVAGGPVQSTGHVGILHELDRLFSLRSGTLHEVGFGLLAYWVTGDLRYRYSESFEEVMVDTSRLLAEQLSADWPRPADEPAKLYG